MLIRNFLVWILYAAFLGTIVGFVANWSWQSQTPPYNANCLNDQSDTPDTTPRAVVRDIEADGLKQNHPNPITCQQKKGRSPEAWTMLFTGFLVFVGIAQAGLFVWQLGLMRRGVIDAEVAARAALDQAKAARLAAEASIGVEVARLNQSRIYLEKSTFAQGLLGSAAPPTSPTTAELLKSGHVTLEFKNEGRTAAEIIAVSFNTMFTADLPPIPVYDDAIPIVPAETAEPNGATWRHYVFRWQKAPVTIPSTYNMLAAALGPGLWAYGYVRYLDFMGDVNEEKFCGRLSLGYFGSDTDFWRSGPRAYFGRSRVKND